MKKKGKEIITFALDRIQHIIPQDKELFIQHKQFEPHTYFDDIIGVTRNYAEKPTLIVFWASPYHAPYIKTKPIHASQKIVEEVRGGTHFSIEVIPNFEMERELIGFGEGVRVLSPNNIVRQIKRKVRLMAALYEAGQE